MAMDKIIREAADERYPKQKEGVPFLCDSSDVLMFQREAFIEGYELGAARERERMMKFSEWASGEGWEYSLFEGIWANRLKYYSKTTSELLEIFNNENKEG